MKLIGEMPMDAFPTSLPFLASSLHLPSLPFGVLFSFLFCFVLFLVLVLFCFSFLFYFVFSSCFVLFFRSCFVLFLFLFLFCFSFLFCFVLVLVFVFCSFFVLSCFFLFFLLLSFPSLSFPPPFHCPFSPCLHFATFLPFPLRPWAFRQLTSEFFKWILTQPQSL